MSQSRNLQWPVSGVELDVFVSLRRIAAEQHRPLNSIVAEAINQYVVARDDCPVAPQPLRALVAHRG